MRAGSQELWIQKESPAVRSTDAFRRVRRMRSRYRRAQNNPARRPVRDVPQILRRIRRCLYDAAAQSVAPRSCPQHETPAQNRNGCGVLNLRRRCLGKARFVGYRDDPGLFGLAQCVRWSRTILADGHRSTSHHQSSSAAASGDQSQPEHRPGQAVNRRRGLARYLASGSGGLPGGSYVLAVVEDRCEFF